MLASRATGDATPRPRVLLLGEAPWVSALASRGDLDVRRAASTAAIVVAETDLAVCGVESLDAVREIRARGSRLPVIVVVKDDTADPVSRAFAAGASEVVREAALAEAVAIFAGLGESGQPRHRVRLSIAISRGGAPETAQLEALSVSEAQVRVPGSLSPGDVLSLDLPLGRPVTLRAVVRGAAPGTASTVARLRFAGLTAEERAALERWLDGLDRETRSTDPADAFVAIRHLDRFAAGAALTSKEAPEWLAQAIADLAEPERALLASKEESPAAAAVFARLRAEALAHVLERFDPALDGEPTAARETVLEVIDGLVEADASMPGRDTGDDPIAGAAVRLKRAVAARLPHLAAAYDAALGRSNALHRMDTAERIGTRARLRRTRHRIYAAIAGVVLGGAVVYSVIATLSGTP